jgi:hypothetical protein
VINRGDLLYLEFELLAHSLDILRVFLDDSTQESEDATVLLQNLVSSFLLLPLVLSGMYEELKVRLLSSTILNVIKPEVTLILVIGD